MTDSTLESIRGLLRRHGADYRELHHEPTYTSEQAAAARGEPLELGGKAIVAKIDDRFVLLVFSAARKIDSKRVKQRFKAKRVRFATGEELRELTGLVPGAVPPFGHPILPLDLYVDESVLQNERVAFNAGSLTRSIVVDRDSYLAAARPVAVFRFAREPPAANP